MQFLTLKSITISIMFPNPPWVELICSLMMCQCPIGYKNLNWIGLNLWCIDTSTVSTLTRIHVG